MTADRTPTVRDLTAALARYSAKLFDADTFRSGVLEAAREYFAAAAAADVDGACWEWAAVIAGWSAWRPHRLDRRLVLPAAADLARVSAACRAWHPDRPGRWRALFGKGSGVDTPKDLLTAAADLLDAVRFPAPLARAAVESLVPLGAEIDRLVSQLSPDWLPARLASLATSLAEAAPDSHQFPLKPGPWIALLAAAGGGDREAPGAGVWWASWLGGAGADWFHQLATLALTSPEARSWLNAVREGVGVACHPELSETGEPFWPVEVPVFPPHISWAPGGRFGAVVSVQRFATVPEAARLTVSSGDGRVNTFEWAAAWEGTGDPGMAAVRTQLARGLTKSVIAQSPPAGNDVLAVLDEINRLDSPPPHELGRVLAAVRAWAETGGCRLVPDPETTIDDRCVVRPVFKRDTVPGTLVRVKAYGLSDAGGLLRPAEVVVSAGPPPHGLTELEAVAGRAPGSPGEELRAAIRELRTAGAGGYLELAAVDLYRLFWDRVRPTWADADGAAAEAFGNILCAVLRETFGLVALVPHSYRDHPADWVTVPPGTRMVTGRVTRVLRPGLTVGDSLRLPAVVEAE